MGDKSSTKNFASWPWRPPEFLPFLRGQLLDMIPGVYLKAISMLPVHAREGHLLHSLVTAGHGPLDPVSNIVINTIWYDVFFPLSKDITSKVGTSDILDTRSMHRVESRSIDGLVAYLYRSPLIDEQCAMTHLCKSCLDISILDFMCDVALVVKHPQPAAFGEFLERASIQGLYNMYCLFRVYGATDGSTPGNKWNNTCCSTNAKICSSYGHISCFGAVHVPTSVRRVLEHLLIGYGYTDPLVCTYICPTLLQQKHAVETFL
jgi:hypothetical protein